MASLCYFCGYMKLLPNDPYSCGCHRDLAEGAETIAPASEAKAKATPLLKRTVPPALLEGSHEDDDDFPHDDGPVSCRNVEYLDWTHTPKMVVQTDGSAQCFISTAKTQAKTRQHALHLVREFDIQPSMAVKKQQEQKARLTCLSKLHEIRVREQDLRKWGNNLEVLSQKALPPLKSTKQASGVDKTKKSVISYRRQRPRPLEDSGQAGIAKGEESVLQEPRWGRRSAKELPRVQPSTTSKHSSSLPRLGVQCKGLGQDPDICDHPSMKKRFDIKAMPSLGAMSTLGSSLSLPSLFSAGKSRPRAWRHPSNPSMEELE